MLDIVVISGAISASLSALISSCFWNIRRSRCQSIEIGNCVKCKRELMTQSELALDNVVA